MILAVAAVVAVVLPLVVVYTAVNGFASISRLDAQSDLILRAQSLQSDTETQCLLLRADVLEAIALSSVDPGRSRTLQEAGLSRRLRQHVKDLHDELDQIERMSLPAGLTAGRTQLRSLLDAFGTRAATLVASSLVSRAGANAGAIGFGRALDPLATAQSTFREELEGAVRDSQGAAHREEIDVASSTSVLAVAMWLALVCLALVLERFRRSRAALLRQIERNTQELATANEQLATAQALAQVGSFEWSSVTGLITGSSEFYRILGSRADDLPPQADPLLDQVHPDDRELLLQQRRTVKEGRVGSEAEYRTVRADGEERRVLVKVAVVADRADGSIRVVGALQDITERRAVEKMKSEFVAVISHELRTPLTAIRGALGLLASGAVGQLTPQALRMADIAVSSSAVWSA